MTPRGVAGELPTSAACPPKSAHSEVPLRAERSPQAHRSMPVSTDVDVFRVSADSGPSRVPTRGLRARTASSRVAATPESRQELSVVQDAPGYSEASADEGMSSNPGVSGPDSGEVHEYGEVLPFRNRACLRTRATPSTDSVMASPLTQRSPMSNAAIPCHAWPSRLAWRAGPCRGVLG